MSTPESNFKAWISKAENDFLNIQNNLASSDVPWDTVCFHAQQAAEKLLKAFLVYKGNIPPRHHDLVALLASCAEIDSTLSTFQEDCQKLTYYAVSARYPDDIYEPTESDARELTAIAHKIRSEILSRLP